MKKIPAFIILAFFIVLPLSAQRGNIAIPNLESYVTLKCDFHTHTVFSDGMVWPTVRIDEAYREGLDAIAITDHIEYRPHKTYVTGSHNSSYEVAQSRARERNIILIRGSEITRSMPPGHFNAIFLANADEMEKPNYMDVFSAAKTQNAFIFWNHPGWENQQPDVTKWWPEHTQLYEQGFMHGIEVVNGGSYYPEAHQWCLEKKLAMIGNSDIHAPMQVFSAGRHRTMTLVFARNRTPEAIYEALMQRRTAVYHNEYVIGEEAYLKELFEKAVEITVTKSGNTARIAFNNKSDLVFHIRGDTHDPRLTYLRGNNLDPYIVRAQNSQTINVRLNDGIQSGDVNLIVENFLVQPGAGMKYKIKL
jgi:predicted metal-dependent phosphoesterase TrpH